VAFMAFLDLSAAFNTVDKAILLNRLSTTFGIQGSGFWATVCKTVSPMLSLSCRSCLPCPVLSVCNVGVLWQNDIKMKVGVQVGLAPGHIVLDGDPAPASPTGHIPQIFGPYLLRQMAAVLIKMPLG